MARLVKMKELQARLSCFAGQGTEVIYAILAMATNMSIPFVRRGM